MQIHNVVLVKCITNKVHRNMINIYMWCKCGHCQRNQLVQWRKPKVLPSLTQHKQVLLRFYLKININNTVNKYSFLDHLNIVTQVFRKDRNNSHFRDTNNSVTFCVWTWTFLNSPDVTVLSSWMAHRTVRLAIGCFVSPGTKNVPPHLTPPRPRDSWLFTLHLWM